MSLRQCGGSKAEWLERWTCRLLDLFTVVIKIEKPAQRSTYKC